MREDILLYQLRIQLVNQAHQAWHAALHRRQVDSCQVVWVVNEAQEERRIKQGAVLEGLRQHQLPCTLHCTCACRQQAG